MADASPVPVYLYSVPAFTGLPWPPGLAPALAAHPRIAGMKESSGDVGLLGRVVSSVPASFEVACGNAPVFYPALCVGAAGGVLAVANCAPRPAIALHRAFVAGDHARARRIQEALTPLAAAVTTTHGVAGLKLAMGLVGLRGGDRARAAPARAPVRPRRDPPPARAGGAGRLGRERPLGVGRHRGGNEDLEGARAQLHLDAVGGLRGVAVAVDGRRRPRR